MKIIVLGSGGQLGSELNRSNATANRADISFLNRSQLDITARELPEKLSSLSPDIIINASAYTAVDQAESDSETAATVNHIAVDTLASVCMKLDCRLIHVSTDFVFDGTYPTPYRPENATNPLSVYGSSKLKGEKAIRAKSGLNFAIIRTAWIYSSLGQNFVKTMLRLMAERDSLNVVYDQVGSPTWAKDLAEVIWQLALRPDITGTYHYTNAGVASWYDFAVAIQEEALALGLLQKTCKISPILTEAYPTPAKRPHYSVLDCSSLEEALGIERPHWRASLRKMLREL